MFFQSSELNGLVINIQQDKKCAHFHKKVDLKFSPKV